MPKISIFEKDLTRGSIEELSSNIAYVPGYAIKGPVNTPTLCETLDEFKQIFGTKPYQFKNTQAWPTEFTSASKPTGDYAFEGDYEKSFIYASELLNAGLPIIFERLMDTENASKFYAKSDSSKLSLYKTDTPAYHFAISAKDPGAYGLAIDYAIDPVLITKTESITENITSDDYIQAGTIIAANSKIAGEEVKSDRTYNIKVNLANGDKIGEGSKIAVGSKIAGETVVASKDAIYKVNVKLNQSYVSGSTTVYPGIFKSISETFDISFDPLSDNYYTKIKSDIVTFDVQDTNGKSVTPTNLYTLIVDSLDRTNLALDSSATGDEFTVSDMYKFMNGTSTSDSIFTKLIDRGEYNLKFITSGSYPVFEYNGTDKELNIVDNSIVKTMLTVAATRGDASAIIDHTNNLTRPLVGDDNTALLSSLQLLPEIPVGSGEKIEDARKYGAMFTPYASYEAVVTNMISILPASFAYLASLANSVKTNANWYAVAGVTRGLVPNLLQVSQTITGAIAEEMQAKEGISINPITNIKPYGYCIWGNRTLNDNDGLVASSFLNIRVLANDVKKVVYKAARKLTFELNSDILWLNFRSEIEPTLDKMVSGNGLTTYKIIRKATTKKATIEAIIRLRAVEAVEDWDITLELADDYVSVQ